MSNQARLGWLPIDIVVNGGPAIISWLNCGSCVSAWFRETRAALIAGKPPPERRESDLKTMVAAAAEVSSVVPSGLIFHISRSGAESVARWVGTTGSALVLSELPPLNVALAPYVRARYAFEWGTELQRAVLPSIVSLYGMHVRDTAPRVVVNFASLNILEASVVRSIWPSVPCIVMVRDPVEIIESHLRRPAPWVRAGKDPLSALAVLGMGREVSGLPNMTQEEYIARVLSRLCDAARDLIKTDCKLVEYRSISTRGAPLTKRASYQREIERVALEYRPEPA